MKEILIKFLNGYDNKITINNKKVDYTQYERKDEMYIDLGKQDLTAFLFMLEEDFEVEEIISNVEDGFLVYEFYITNDVCLGEDDDIGEIYNVETRVNLISRNYKRVYHSYLNSEEWHDKRNKMLEYSDYKCSMCSASENLQVHHLNYNTVGNESLGDLLVVCNSCHKKIHKIYNIK
jgi:hypothetical protein